MMACHEPGRGEHLTPVNSPNRWSDLLVWRRLQCGAPSKLQTRRASMVKCTTCRPPCVSDPITAMLSGKISPPAVPPAILDRQFEIQIHTGVQYARCGCPTKYPRLKPTRRNEQAMSGGSEPLGSHPLPDVLAVEVRVVAGHVDPRPVAVVGDAVPRDRVIERHQRAWDQSVSP